MIVYFQDLELWYFKHDSLFQTHLMVHVCTVYLYICQLVGLLLSVSLSPYSAAISRSPHLVHQWLLKKNSFSLSLLVPWNIRLEPYIHTACYFCISGKLLVVVCTLPLVPAPAVSVCKVCVCSVADTKFQLFSPVGAVNRKFPKTDTGGCWFREKFLNSVKKLPVYALLFLL